MNQRVILGRIFILIVGLTGLYRSSAARFQEPGGNGGSPTVRHVTGCLTKGDSSDEFLLNGNDGSTWVARSSKVNLADHVGHTVAVTGMVSNAAHDMKKDNSEHGHLKITDIKIVSESCRK